MDLNSIMRDFAERAYQEVGERHAYTGLLAGLAAVARSLGLDVDRRYLSSYYHDPLVGFCGNFERGDSFREIVRMWDKMWFGLGTGNIAPLEYPWSNLASLYRPRYGGPSQDLREIAQQVEDELKKRKIRRNTRRHAEFIQQYYQRVLDAAVESATNRSTSQAKELAEHRKKLSEKLDAASERLKIYEEGAILRSKMLSAAELAGAALTDRHEQHLIETWRRVVDQLSGMIDEVDRQVEQAANPNLAQIAAVEALAHDPTLRPFAVATGLVTTT
jgi:histone H3/H4